MKALVLLSGGLDSTTCAAQAIRDCGVENVSFLSIIYGQRHTTELASSQAVAEHYHRPRYIIDLSQAFCYSDSAMLANGTNVEQGTYEEQLENHDEPTTAVPFRNGVFIAAAASLAEQLGCDRLYIGIHKGDAGVNYYDCREDFFDAMKLAVYIGTGNKVTLVAPFVKMRKVDIVHAAKELLAPVGLTWSCYEGGDKPCGKCATCLERTKAFSEAGYVDPALTGKTYIWS